MRASSAACAECRDLLGGYVLGALEPAEAEIVRAHLDECAACALEHDQLAGIPRMLDMAGAEDSVPESPPPALEEAVLDRFAREHGAHPERDRMPFWDWVGAARARLSRPLSAALAGAVAAAAVTAVVLLLPAGARHDRVASGEAYQAALAAAPAAPGARADARLVTFSAGTRVHLRVHGLHGGPSTVYELWCLRDDGVKVSAGTFRTDADGSADVNLTTAAVPGEYHRLSVERQAGRSGQPVLAGDIQYGRS
jgi:anti-sigma factor RsiW